MFSFLSQVVKSGSSETRVEKRIVITADSDIDQDKVQTLCDKNNVHGTKHHTKPAGFLCILVTMSLWLVEVYKHFLVEKYVIMIGRGYYSWDSVQLQPVLIEQGLQLCNLSTDYLAQG